MTSLAKATEAAVVVLAISACGGSTPPPKVVEEPVNDDEPRPEGPSLAVSGEIGALDKRQVDNAFEKSVNDLSRCLEAGAKRVEFIAGAVAFYVKIDSRGQLAHAHLEQSSIGDRETEKCMLEALRRREWPAPVGGETGFARKSFDFDAPNGVRAPFDWTPDRVQAAVDDKSSDIRKCKGSAPGTYNATMYVDERGHALAVGMAPPDERGEGAVDCLVDVLKNAKYPSPGSYPAKVAFTL